MTLATPPINDLSAPPADPTASWLGLRMALRGDLRSTRRRDQGDDVVVVEDPLRNKFFQFGADEYRFAQSLDGQATVEQTITRWQADNPRSPIDTAAAVRICTWLVSANLVVVDHRTRGELLRQTAEQKVRQRRTGRFNLLAVRIPLGNPQRLLAACDPIGRWLFSGWGVAGWIVLAIWGISCLASEWPRFCDASQGILAGGRWCWLLVAWVGLKMIHELGHGLAARRLGIETRRAGILLLVFAPLAYVDVTPAWRLESRWQRILISAAGMYTELAVAMVAAIVWSRLDGGLAADLAHNIIIMASVTTLVINANPLMRFDGYYIFSDLTGTTNLASRGAQWVSDTFRRLVFGWPAEHTAAIGWRRPLIATYGILALGWRVMVSVGLLLAASTLFDGAGLVLAVIGGVFWLVMPAAQFVRTTTRLVRAQGMNWRRSLVAAGVVAGVCAAGVWLALRPAQGRAPALVQFDNQCVVRADLAGWVREIFVVDGQLVDAGQPLVRLENAELAVEVDGLAHRIAQTEIAIRIHQRKGELALAQAESETRDQLAAELAEKQTWLEAQTIRAPASGRVVQRSLATRLDTYLDQGDEVLVIAPGQAKSIVVSLDQTQVDAARSSANRTIPAYFSGVGWVETQLVEIEPRASQHLPDASLGAQAGGPLAVRLASTGPQDEYRLVTPHFTARLAIDAPMAERLWAGQRGVVRFPSSQLTIAQQMMTASRHWIARKLGTAD